MADDSIAGLDPHPLIRRHQVSEQQPSWRPCALCGSTKVVWKKTNKLAKTLFLTPALLMKGKPHCAACGAVRQA